VSGQNFVPTKIANDGLQCMLRNLKWTVTGSYCNKYQLWECWQNSDIQYTGHVNKLRCE